MTRHMIQTVLITASLSLALSGGTRAADEPSLDDLLKIPTKPAPKDDSGKPADDHKLPIDPNIAGEEEMSGDAIVAAIKGAVKDMDVVASRLNQDQDPGLDTQRLQESILLRLDKIIAAAKKQQQGGGGSSSQKKPQQDQSGNKQNEPKAGQSKSNQPELHDPSGDQFSKGQVAPHDKGGAIDELRSEWGHLPPRLRDELIQGRDDKFSATYKTLTQEYYRRLAEEGR